MNPDINSFLNTDSRQWLFLVPAPPVFSTGTAAGPVPFSTPHSVFAVLPVNVGFEVLAPASSLLWGQMVPMPMT